jgi:hypothetical protein
MIGLAFRLDICMATITSTAAYSARPSEPAGLPWYIWCAALAVTSAVIGGHWDISWHKSIGRDTFWTPAHIAIYLCGVLAGVAFGYIILYTTFSKSAPLAESSVHIWGFRAPLGAFIASWGGIAMLTSAPFDNWWHDAYGLDVQIVSPPHILLFIGLYGVFLGTLALLAGHMNRVSGPSREVSRWLFLCIGGMMLIVCMVVLMEYTGRIFLHSPRPYILVSAITPIVFAVGWQATRIKFAATFIAGFYTLFIIGLILVLPLFPAQPKLGPVYQHVTQFIPPEFPMLLIVPALALDLWWQRSAKLNPWKIAAFSGVLFVAVLVIAEWPFANFLMSPLARNRFFGTMYFFYGLPPSSYPARYEFFPNDGALAFWRGIAIACALCTLAVRWGISRGRWFSEIKR